LYPLFVLSPFCTLFLLFPLRWAVHLALRNTAVASRLATGASPSKRL
jgi:hypothetical protein